MVRVRFLGFVFQVSLLRVRLSFNGFTIVRFSGEVFRVFFAVRFIKGKAFRVSF